VILILFFLLEACLQSSSGIPCLLAYRITHSLSFSAWIPDQRNCVLVCTRMRAWKSILVSELSYAARLDLVSLVALVKSSLGLGGGCEVIAGCFLYSRARAQHLSHSRWSNFNITTGPWFTDSANGYRQAPWGRYEWEGQERTTNNDIQCRHRKPSREEAIRGSIARPVPPKPEEYLHPRSDWTYRVIVKGKDLIVTFLAMGKIGLGWRLSHQII